MKTWGLAALAVLLAAGMGAGPTLAGGGDDCTCNNLESLQQDYQNAIYLEKFMRKLSEKLKAWETTELEQKAKGLGSVDIAMTSSAKLKIASETAVRLPFPKVKGYKGPERISMESPSCEQSKAELDALVAGSPCKGMAEAALAHELSHQEICRTMGAATYWARPGSEKALEEAERYKEQARFLKGELGRVLDKAEITFKGDWRYTVAGEGMEIIYNYEFASKDIGPTSSAGDQWSFVGTGEAGNAIESFKAQGMSCTSEGQVTNAFTVTMDTDGLTFGLGYSEQNSGGDLVIRCDMGGSMAMPTGDTASGQFTTKQPLRAGDNELPNAWADTIMAMAAAGGMSITGVPRTVLNVSCPKP